MQQHQIFRTLVKLCYLFNRTLKNLKKKKNTEKDFQKTKA